MGVKEAFLEKKEARLSRLRLDILELKDKIETNDLGDNREWLDRYEMFRELFDKTEQMIRNTRQERGVATIHDNKVAIESLIDELVNLVEKTRQQFD